MARVLIVEDEEPVVKVWRKVLEGAGHQVLAASTCKEACAIMRTEGEQGKSLDVVLLDDRLPDGTGRSLLKPLAIHVPGAAVAAVSAHVDAELSVELGFSALPVPKPLSAETLLKLVETLRPSPEGPRGKCATFAATHHLTQRETQVLSAAVLGLSAADAAEEIGCAVSTLYTHWRRIFIKTGYRTQWEVVSAILRSD